jgi:NAD(P)H-flavin reductase
MMTSINNVGEGWHELIRTLEENLNKIDPEFELQQVKEKFGGLRYYAQTSGETGAYDSFHQLISLAEEASFHLCEVCGEPGECKATRQWLKTLCETHRAEDEERRLAEDKQLGI